MTKHRLVENLSDQLPREDAVVLEFAPPDWPSLISKDESPHQKLTVLRRYLIRGFQAARSEPDRPLELIQPIQSGHFVGFRQGGVVEHRVAEILERATQCEHGLADMDDFGSAIANYMDAE